jgi:hypothetical protein
MNILRIIFLLPLTFVLLRQTSYGQINSCEEADKELTNIYSKIFPFYYGDQDSLDYYSGLFANKITNYINNNPLTLTCKFKMLIDSNVCSIVTSIDGSFRIYSWDTWQGGTMHRFRNIYQFKLGNKVYTKNLNDDEEDFGAYYTDIFTLKANSKTYYLAVSGGSESTKDAYEQIQVYSVSGNLLNDTVSLIKTQNGLKNSIGFEYDFFSVVDRPERPIRLIKYDVAKKIIYIPVVLENGKVTDRFILYQFTGQYFEKKINKHK